MIVCSLNELSVEQNKGGEKGTCPLLSFISSNSEDAQGHVFPVFHQWRQNSPVVRHTTGRVPDLNDGAAASQWDETLNSQLWLPR